MRIATWNVNSLKARLEKVLWWLERAQPDVLLMQETKLADGAAPLDAFRGAGYELAHHGEGRWNGVAVASRSGITDVVANFGQPLRPAQTEDVGDDEPLAETRMIAATCGGVRVVSVYAPNGRSVDSIFYEAKLAWYERLARWLAEAADPNEALVVVGDFNVAPDDADVWVARLGSRIDEIAQDRLACRITHQIGVDRLGEQRLAKPRVALGGRHNAFFEAPAASSAPAGPIAVVPGLDAPRICMIIRGRCSSARCDFPIRRTLPSSSGDHVRRERALCCERPIPTFAASTFSRRASS